MICNDSSARLDIVGMEVGIALCYKETYGGCGLGETFFVVVMVCIHVNFLVYILTQ